MGFYIRKSFRAGPIRFNLSRRGLGASIGVKGARVGVSSSGRAYVSGGVAPVYFRSNLGGSTGSDSRRSSSGAGEAISVQVDTGATFERQHGPALGADSDFLGTPPNHHVAATILGIPAATLLFLVAIASNAEQFSDPRTAGNLALLVLAVAATLWVVLVARQARRALRARTFGRSLSKAAHDPGAGQLLRRLREETQATADEVAWHARGVYVACLEHFLANRKISDAELERLSLLESVFEIPSAFAGTARVFAFRKVHLEAVSDHALDAEEEASLKHIRDRLTIPDAEITEEIEAANRLIEIRAIREGELPVIEPSAKLQRDEVCHFQGPARLVKQKVLRRFQEEGQKHKVEGLTIEKEGTLLVTSKRLLLMHEGTTSIRLDKILDVEVDLDRNLISIVKDGAQKPVLFTTPDAQRAGAVLSVAARL